jgi:hypothetical protein
VAYNKHIWVAPEGDNLNRFSKTNETDTSVDLVQNPNLTNNPTPFSAEWINEMEEGIFAAHEKLDEMEESAEEQFAMLSGHADEVDGMGRDLMKVTLGHGIEEMTTPSLINEAVLETVAALSERLNNNGEIDGSGIPNPRGLMIGDYIDGIDLSAIPAENSGDAGQAWNDTYKNNRIVISGFNTYKGFGDTEVTKNHILFTFRNIPLRKRINATAINTGGYPASEVRVFLEGANGDGTGNMAGVTTAAFLNALKAKLGSNHLLTIRKNHYNKNTPAWKNYTLFFPSDLELFGYPTYGEEGVYGPTDRGGYNTNVHFKIYHSGAFRIKRYNGARATQWTQTPTAAGTTDFAFCSGAGAPFYNTANSVNGCAPAFCVL